MSGRTARYGRLVALGLVAALALAGCAPQEPAVYPISGQECGPDDPVRDMNARDCMPLP